MEGRHKETPDLLGIALPSFELILHHLDKEELFQLRAVSRAAKSRVNAFVQHFHRANLHTVKIERCPKKRTRVVRGKLTPKNDRFCIRLTPENRDTLEKALGGEIDSLCIENNVLLTFEEIAELFESSWIRAITVDKDTFNNDTGASLLAFLGKLSFELVYLKVNHWKLDDSESFMLRLAECSIGRSLFFSHSEKHKTSLRDLFRIGKGEESMVSKMFDIGCTAIYIQTKNGLEREESFQLMQEVISSGKVVLLDVNGLDYSRHHKFALSDFKGNIGDYKLWEDRIEHVSFK